MGNVIRLKNLDFTGMWGPDFLKLMTLDRRPGIMLSNRRKHKFLDQTVTGGIDSYHTVCPPLCGHIDRFPFQKGLYIDGRARKAIYPLRLGLPRLKLFSKAIC